MATENKVIIITGASRGIGEAIALALHKEPACNIFATARSESALSALQSRDPSRIATAAEDMADPEAGTRIVYAALQRWGRIDGLIINHGSVEPVQRIADADVGAWKTGFESNVFGVLGLIRDALPFLRVTNGNIILTSSGAAVKGTAAWGAYSASKAVLNSLARTLAVEEPSVGVLAIRPGVVDTQMQDTLKDEHYGKMESKDVQRFVEMREKGEMLKPEMPGAVMARLVLRGFADKIESGDFVNWNDERLQGFQ